MSETQSEKKAGVVFIVKTIVVYVTWVIVRKSMKGISFLRPAWDWINDFAAEIYVEVSSHCLAPILGYMPRFNERNIFMNGTNGMYVGDFCLGISAMFIYTMIIVVLKGKWIYKIPYIIFGLAIIFVINTTRIVSLALLLAKKEMGWFDFSHDYAYLIVVYGIIFILITTWEAKLSTKGLKKTEV